MFRHFLPLGLDKARTVAFATISMFELFQLYNMRSIEESLLKIKPFSNKWVNLGVLGAMAFMAIAFFVPFFQHILKFTPLTLGEIAAIIPIAFSIVIVAEFYKLIVRRIKKNKTFIAK